MKTKKISIIATQLINSGHADLASQVVKAAGHDDLDDAEFTQKQDQVKEANQKRIKLAEDCDVFAHVASTLKKLVLSGNRFDLNKAKQHLEFMAKNTIPNLLDDMDEVIELTHGK